ncbi:hypothetical protein [Paraburkholderia domus]|uniref:hypothetical protein n=1 Tax=Paraburkholderia domus TaxID=2793075 RepID=UPI00191487C4|nr:hypothetical protein [Paraburkholderia domus]MBK5118334.1 hypothetical protein [Burkholderia sp. R-69980]MBK5179791.1 hypothetical protein [Burkholderia sp. R-69749]MCI0144421.1 hypothetical protein [Paraburkholderia sediminicola]CAE6770486.1 hypothetical protein R69749_01211 [Paraburkholderia domus]
MKYYKYIFICFMTLSYGIAPVESIADEKVSVEGISDSEILIKKSGYEHRCTIDQNPINLKLSSDGQSAIVSGTSFIPVSDLMQCDPTKIVYAKLAAPHVGFLSDVNLRAGLYASLVPVAVNPMSFLAVVAKIGSDKNIVNLPGFYRVGVRVPKILSEASSNISPVISLDGHYISLDLYSCDFDGYMDAFDIELNKKTRIDRELCEKLFNFR